MCEENILHPHTSAVGTKKLYTRVGVGPQTSSRIVGTRAPTQKREKRLALQEGGSSSPVSFTGTILSKSLELFSCMQAEGFDGGGEQ